MKKKRPDWKEELNWRISYYIRANSSVAVPQISATPQAKMFQSRMK
jgi:hypothetical protein